MKLSVNREAELITKLPRYLLPTFEELAKSRGFKDSRAFMARFVQKQLGLHLKIDPDDPRLSQIH
jgi:hypothetical protein